MGFFVNGRGEPTVNPSGWLERRVLAGLLEFPEAYYLLDWDDDFFEDTLNRKVLGLVVEQFEAGMPVDRLLVANVAGRLGDQAVVQRVYECWVDSPFSLVDLRFWHLELKKNWAERVIRLTGRDLADNPERYQQAIELLQSLNVEASSQGVETVQEFRGKYLEKRKTGVEIISTGEMIMDRLLEGGWRAGLYGVAGRPKQGKSMVMLHLARKLADTGRRVLFVSLEMPVDQVMDRLIAGITGIDSNLIAKHELDFELEFQGEIVWAADLVAKVQLPDGLVVVSPDSRSPHDIQNLIVQTKNKLGGLDAVFIDYVQIMDYPARFSMKHEGNAWLANQLQRLSMRLHLPIISGLQLKKPDSLNDKKLPGLNDIAESDQYGRDAVAVFYIVRKRLATEPEWALGSELILNLATSRFVANGSARFIAEDKYSRINYLAWR